MATYIRFRTVESHILQVRPKLPQAIGNVEYIAYGMPSLSVYLPYYQGMRHYQPGDDKGTDRASNDSTYWTFRTLQTLVMQDYNAFAPDVQHAGKHLNSKQLSSSIRWNRAI